MNTYTVKRLVHVSFLVCSTLAGKRAEVVCASLQKTWDEVQMPMPMLSMLALGLVGGLGYGTVVWSHVSLGYGWAGGHSTNVHSGVLLGWTRGADALAYVVDLVHGWTDRG